MQIGSYVGKEEAILAVSQGRTVLHLGCVGFTDQPAEERVELARQSLHWKLSRIADTVGVDYSQPVIDEYRRLGIFDNVVFGDVQQLDEVPLDSKFEVVVAADIIEHLSCPGLMLEGIKRFCRDSTRVVITTPHAFGILNYIRFVFGRFRDGNEHVLTFNTDNVSNLLSRHGYRIDRLDTCYQAQAERKGVLFHLIRSFLSLLPRLGGTLLIVARVAR